MSNFRYNKETNPKDFKDSSKGKPAPHTKSSESKSPKYETAKWKGQDNHKTGGRG